MGFVGFGGFIGFIGFVGFKFEVLAGFAAFGVVQ